MNFIERHKKKVIVAAAIIVVSAVIYVDKLLAIGLKFNDFVAQMIRRGIDTSGGTTSTYVKSWLSWGIVCSLILAVLILAAAFIHSHRESQKLNSALADLQRLQGVEQELRNQITGLQKEKEGALEQRLKKEDILRKTFKRMMATAYRITQQTSKERPKKDIQAIDNVYRIHQNFDGEVSRRYELVALETLHFGEIWLGAETDATPVDYLDEIDFKVTDENGLSLPYLPTENEPYSKKVAIFFLPPLAPNEKKTILVKFKWAGLFAKLSKLGGFERNEWHLTRQSAGTIPSAKFSFFVDPALGKTLRYEVDGPKFGNPTVKPASGTHNWLGICYELTNAPEATYALRIELS